MIKAVPFIQTIGTEKFKEFVSQPFKAEQLDSGDNSQVLFDGWKYTEEDVYVNKTCRTQLNFYSTFYTVHTKDANYKVPMPTIIDEFVSDMARYNVQLCWDAKIDEMFEPKDYLDKDEIRQYFETLLNRMGKYNELK